MNQSQRKLMNYKNYNQSKSKSQTYFLKNPEIIKEIKNDPELLGVVLTSAGKKLTDYFISRSNHCRLLYMRQDTIADHTDLSLRTVNRLITHLVSLGLVAKKKRDYTSCVYRLSSFFSSMEIRNRLLKWFPSLKYLPLALLYSLSLSSAVISNIPIKSNFGVLLYYCKSIYRNDINDQKSFLHKKGILKKNSISAIPLPFSLSAYAIVARYPDYVIEYALRELPALKKSVMKQYSCSNNYPTYIENCIRLFLYVCKNYAQQNKSILNTHLTTAIVRHYKLSHHEPLVDTSSRFYRPPNSHNFTQKHDNREHNNCAQSLKGESLNLATKRNVHDNCVYEEDPFVAYAKYKSYELAYPHRVKKANFFFSRIPAYTLPPSYDPIKAYCAVEKYRQSEKARETEKRYNYKIINPFTNSSCV